MVWPFSHDPVEEKCALSFTWTRAWRMESGVQKKVPENHRCERFAYEEALKLLQYAEIVPGGQLSEKRLGVQRALPFYVINTKMLQKQHLRVVQPDVSGVNRFTNRTVIPRWAIRA